MRGRGSQVKHVWRLPDSGNISDFEFVPNNIAANSLRNWKQKQLGKMWQRWIAVKQEMNRELLAEQNKRVAIIALEIDAARQIQMLEDEEQRRLNWLKADAADTASWLERLTKV